MLYLGGIDHASFYSSGKGELVWIRETAKSSGLLTRPKVTQLESGAWGGNGEEPDSWAAGTLSHGGS